MSVLTEPHGVTSQKMKFFRVTSVKTSDLTSEKISVYMHNKLNLLAERLRQIHTAKRDGYGIHN
jgi:hypothetical protein